MTELGARFLDAVDQVSSIPYFDTACLDCLGKHDPGHVNSCGLIFAFKMSPFRNFALGVQKLKSVLDPGDLPGCNCQPFAALNHGVIPVKENGGSGPPPFLGSAPSGVRDGFGPDLRTRECPNSSSSDQHSYTLDCRPYVSSTSGKLFRTFAFDTCR